MNTALKITAAGVLAGGAAAAAWWLKGSQGDAGPGDDSSPGDGAAVATPDVGQDAGGRAHTAPGDGHPAGDGPRSDRDVGGPTTPEGSTEDAGGAQGTKSTGLPAHD